MTIKRETFALWRAGRLGRLALLLALALTTQLAAAAELVFSITEGITYYQTNKEIQAKFAPLADLLSKALKQPVRMVIVSSYNDLRDGLEHQSYDLSFVHPAHVALGAIKAGKYRSIAWTTGYTDYSVMLLANKEQPFATLDDLRGHTIVSPDPDSITAWMLRAMLRDQKLKPGDDLKIITTRYQDAVPFYVQYGFATVGATAAKSVAKDWTDKGGKVVLTSRPVPIKQWIVSTKLSAEDADKIRAVLLGVGQNDPGKQALSTLGYKGFVPTNRDDELKAIAWLGL
ncbi:MAG TPA: phosphate/phosphite/phosphonate ABC transporter substrate-binding protein [Casimicrobiaceae bacterium]|nr:phosphate/phosphite/phosphonate ABC transporter substrate-binding protein [Casimicrobiaceae bacterium]